ncbi:hypothetical protein KEM54_003671 [Ascosphaera aggregata]|nr:hypothetical protein KEM54_003671 [Ascosphaera aggregata]
MAPNRTSSRRAAFKANEAISKSSETGASKRKSMSSPSGASKPKTQKSEISSSEAPKDASTQAHKQSPPTETKSPQVKEETHEQKPPVDLKKEAEETFGGAKDVPPSNVLEKGIIYFFFRGRVQIDEPESLDQVARSFIVFRPLPLDSTLAGGALTDEQNCRLVMLPKKILPTSPKQRYMAFVEKAKVDVKTIRDSFAGEEHETKTRGVRHTPAATPYAEGVYAITHTNKTSHLSYVLTIPQQVSEVQEDFGLADRGSFIVASKNPKFPGPAIAQLPKGPDYPPDVVEKMGDLRWVPVQPEFIDYLNAQIVIIGEKQESFGSGGLTEDDEKGADGQTAADELEKLEHVDEVRVEKLNGAEAIFDDLGLSKKQFPDVESTWK